MRWENLRIGTPAHILYFHTAENPTRCSRPVPLEARVRREGASSRGRRLSQGHGADPRVVLLEEGSSIPEEGSAIHGCVRRLGTPGPTGFHTAENDATGCCFWRSFSTACREVVMLQSCDVAVGVIRPERL